MQEAAGGGEGLFECAQAGGCGRVGREEEWGEDESGECGDRHGGGVQALVFFAPGEHALNLLEALARGGVVEPGGEGGGVEVVLTGEGGDVEMGFDVAQEERGGVDGGGMG